MKLLLNLSLITCLSCFYLQIQGQQVSKTDSLVRILQKSALPDSVKFKALMDLALIYENPEKDSGALLLNQAAAFLPRLKENRYKAALAYCKGRMYNNLNEKTQADSMYKQAIKFLKKPISTADKALAGDIFFAKGISNNWMGDYDSAISDMMQSLNWYQQISDSSNMAGCLNSIGVNHYLKGSYDSSLHYYRKALRFYTLQNKIKLQAMAQANIGMVYKALQKFDIALSHYRHASQIANQIQDPKIQADYYQKIGTIYDEKELPDSALSYYNKAYILNVNIGNTYAMAQNQTNMAIVYFGKKSTIQPGTILKNHYQFFWKQKTGGHTVQHLVIKHKPCLKKQEKKVQHLDILKKKP